MRDWKSYVRRRLSLPGLRPERLERIVQDIAGQLEDFYREARSGGASEAEADAFARDQITDWKQFSSDLRTTERSNLQPNLERWHDRAEDAALETASVEANGGMDRIRFLLANLQRDVVYASRVLAASPVFTAVSILTLALGIGATTTIFSLVHGILIKPLPYPEPDRLVRVTQSYRQKGLFSWQLSQANFATYRDRAKAFETLSAYAASGANLTGMGNPERLQVANVTADFFRTLGVRALHGRTFIPEEETPGKNSVCVLSHGFWQERFGGDPGVIGKQLRLNDHATEIVGILPQGFNFPPRSPRVALWMPLALNPERTSPYFLRGIGRLKPGVAPSEAAAETTTLFRNVAREIPQFASGNEPPPEGADLKTEVVPLREAIAGETKTALVVLFCAVGMVLLIACANMANLMLARATARAQEIAVRTALGATRRRIVQQLLTESLYLAVFGGAVGVVLSWWAVRRLRHSSIAGIPRIDELGVDPAFLVFAVSITLLAGLLFGLAPAKRAHRLGVEAGLREGIRNPGSRSGRRANSVLVAAQFALSLVLLVGAGLLLRSFQSLTAVDPGFDPDNVLTMRLSLPEQKYRTVEQANAFFGQLLERVRVLPGVVSAGMVTGLPFSGDNDSDGYVVEGHEPPPGGVVPITQYRYLSPGYLDAVGISLVSGRDFADADREGSERVAIIDRTLERRYWPGGNSIGKRIRFGWSNEWMTVVGVVGGVKDSGLEEELSPHLYLPHAQWPSLRMNLAIRIAGDPLSIAPAVRSEVRQLDSALPVYGVQTMVRAVGESLSRRRFTQLLLSGFAFAALLLAAIGVYGVVSLGVSSRSSEFGIRLSLGARPRQILFMVILRSMLVACAGVAVGLMAAFWLSRFIEGLLFEIRATDPVTYLAVTLILLGVALVASLVPARRASKVDPMSALRYE